jgi:hypothetical protein
VTRFEYDRSCATWCRTPPDDEKSIFLPYRRSTRGRRDAASVGLGLWICQQLAKAMGGRLEYRRDNGWTEFELTMPVASSELDPSVSVPVAATSATHMTERPSLTNPPRPNQSSIGSVVAI